MDLFTKRITVSINVMFVKIKDSNDIEKIETSDNEKMNSGNYEE